VTSHQNILLVYGDITKYPVDAIVNAANKELDHIGGIALAIANAGTSYHVTLAAAVILTPVIT
jgi:O-acetyl-ADP-ribose deacetylase (regulator of RNase III)